MARTHPDAGGSEELFVWTQALREELCDASLAESGFASRVWEEFLAAQCAGSRSEARPKNRPRQSKRSTNRIYFDTALSFNELTDRALEIADTLEEPYRALVPLLLDGCELSRFGCDLAFIEAARTVGAFYARVADASHALRLDEQTRLRLYKFAKRVPLSDLHAVHMVNRARHLAHEAPELVKKIREAAACHGG